MNRPLQTITRYRAHSRPIAAKTDCFFVKGGFGAFRNHLRAKIVPAIMQSKK